MPAFEAEQLLAKLAKRTEEGKDPWYRTLLSLYDLGASDREVMRALDLTPAAFEALYKDATASNFAELVDLGRGFAHAWWESQGRVNLQNPKFQTSLWTIQMKNRFGWSEKSEQSMTNLDFRNLDDDSLKREVDSLLEQYRKTRAKG